MGLQNQQKTGKPCSISSVWAYVLGKDIIKQISVLTKAYLCFKSHKYDLLMLNTDLPRVTQILNTVRKMHKHSVDLQCLYAPTSKTARTEEGVETVVTR